MSDRSSNRIRNHFLGSANIMRRTFETCAGSIEAAADRIAESFRAGGKVLLCGNGGSAADCQHMAAEFVSRLTKDFERPGLPAIALTTDTSFLTAFTNDCGYEGVFERQVQALGKRGDVLIGISTSGSSSNVVRAVRAARDLGMRTICFTGQGGGLQELSDLTIAVPSRNTQYIQEAHQAIIHSVCELVERSLFGDDDREREGPVTSAASMFANAVADANTQVRVNAAVVLRNEQGAILLEKRRDCGLWGLPGGRVEPGESIRQAAERELLEETGYTIRVDRLLGVYSGPQDRVITFPDNIVQIVDILVQAEIVSGQLTLSHESEAMQFFAPEQVPPAAELIPPARQVLADLLAQKTGIIA